MSPRDIEDIYELSPLQRGMLFHTIYAPSSRVFIEQESFPLAGPLDVPKLVRAWQQVVDRHSALRSSFHWEGLEKPVQVVHRHVQLPANIEDWRGLDAEQQTERLHGYLSSIREQGFDLSKAPLIRVAVFKLSNDVLQFVLSFHHILFDGWSSRIITQEVWSLYEAYCDGKEPRLPPAQPYGHFIAWLQRQDMRAAEAFWRRTLRGFAAPTPLGIDRIARPDSEAVMDHGDETLRCSRQTTAALQHLVRENRLTLNTLIQGAWAVVLSRYGAQTDVVFGTVVSGRPATLPGVESMVGLFINTLPLRTEVPPEARLLTWLKDLQTRQLEARDYDYSELVHVQRWSDVPPGTPLFESIVIFENYPVSDPLTTESDEAETSFHCYEKSNYPLNLMVTPGPRLELKILYDGQRFDESSIRAMLGHLRTFLDGVIANADRPLGEISLVSPVERRRLLAEFNATRAAYPLDAGIPELFAAQLAISPQATAFVCRDDRITYAELESRSNRLACDLQSLGVGPEQVVGICIDRSIDFVVAVLATFKAGGAYLPLDPAYPRGWLTFMMKDAGAGVLLTVSRVAAQFPEAGARVLCLDSDRAGLPVHSDSPVRGRLSARQLACVIYTSDSTGERIGVAVEHTQVLNRLCWMWEKYPFAADEVACQITAAARVDSIWEFFGALLMGIPTVIVRNEVLRDPGRLVRELAYRRVTRVSLAPSVLLSLLHTHADLAAGLPRLRFWVTSGEVPTPALCRRFRTQMPGAVLHNVYGGPEVGEASWTDPALTAVADSRSLVGKPIGNVRAYILDAHKEPVPMGVSGELYVGGAGLARGYLNRAELTAAAFVPDPFADPPGARLYRTGDRARYLPDGTIEYLGRLDQQVRIRGFRIAPGEVETVLSRHPRVRKAAVVADCDAEVQLIAYVVANSGEEPSHGVLRSYLQERLPDHMLPALVLLDDLPFTPSGELDRAQLPGPAGARSRNSRSFVPPRSPVERVIAAMYGDVLADERVSIDDDFFDDLGGNSMLAAKLVSRVRDIFQIDLPLRVTFDRPTVRAFAEHLLAEPGEGYRVHKTAELLMTVAECPDDEIDARLRQSALPASNMTINKTNGAQRHERLR